MLKSLPSERVKSRLCPLIAFDQIVGGKYKLRILWVLSKGPKRYGEIQRSLVLACQGNPVTPRDTTARFTLVVGSGFSEGNLIDSMAYGVSDTLETPFRRLPFYPSELRARPTNSTAHSPSRRASVTPLTSRECQKGYSQRITRAMECQTVFTRKKDLDGVRGVAVLLVIFLHYVCRSGVFGRFEHGRIALLLDSAWSGVDIFFVLSGFLIGGIIIDHGRADNFLRVFYLRRALRIVPLAWLVIAFSYGVLPLLNPAILWHVQVPGYAYPLFISNFWTSVGRLPYGPLGPMWSLAIEEQFYLIAPMLLLTVGARTRNVMLAVVVLISPWLRLSNLGLSGWDFTLFRLDGLACGMLLASLLRDPKLHQLLLRKRRAISAAAILLVGTDLLFVSSPQLPVAERVAFGISLNSLSAAGIILSLQVEPDSWLSNALSRSWWVVTGRYSYFLYLVHMPMAFYTLSAFGNHSTAWCLVIALGITCAAAWASWHFMESKLIQLGKEYTYTSPKTLPAPRLAAAATLSN